MITRRVLVVLVALGLLAVPLAGDAQQRGKTWRVGFLSGGALTPEGGPPPALQQALRELGYVEQKNVVYLARSANAKQDRLPALAVELVELKVDVIVTAGGPATAAARQATSTIPIVMATVGDADGLGLINSLAHPGGNVTGVTDQSAELSAKRLELLKEAVPKAERIAVLWNADDRGMTMRFENVEKAAQLLRVTVQPLGVREPNDFDAAFAAMTQRRPDALFLVTDALTLLNRKRVIEFAALHRIPTMYEVNFLVQDGGLMSYGASFDDNYRRAAGYVDRIFKGAVPSALPVERPSRYYLAINLKTARTLGLTMPQSLLLRADQIVE
ncbi:MAG TPA: ABC transporter substrate-binding protein [Hyphomicrobiaceae bacterium]|nr:ABC transporter substrate-binding protein [Hyphomicrobiaceae bacterium]